MDEQNMLFACLGGGALAVLYGIFAGMSVLKMPDGNEEMRKIASAIQEGASAYMNRQYTTVLFVGIALAVVIGVALGPVSAAGFVLGALLSAAAGFAGMFVPVRANVSTTEAVRSSM